LHLKHRQLASYSCDSERHRAALRRLLPVHQSTDIASQNASQKLLNSLFLVVQSFVIRKGLRFVFTEINIVSFISINRLTVISA